MGTAAISMELRLTYGDSVIRVLCSFDCADEYQAQLTLTKLSEACLVPQQVGYDRFSWSHGEFEVTRGRLTRAAERVLELDAMAHFALQEGHAVTKTIPRQNTGPLPTFEPGQAGQRNYWALRQSTGALIRPLLLKRPRNGRLYPYQRKGVAWLLRHPRGILADDMGLGKTVQALAGAQQLLCRGLVNQALVVSPTSLLANWEDAALKWTPELSVARVTPTGAIRGQVWKVLENRVHILLTNYEQIRGFLVMERTPQPGLIVADEAHRLRNVDADVTRGAQLLEPEWFWALTGTPIERDKEDLVTLLSTLDPRRFSSSDARLEPSTIRARARPYILRRRKEEVLTQLPPVIDTKEHLELTLPQRRRYDRERRRLRGASRDGENALQIVGALRAICDYDPESGASSKLDRACEIIEEVRANNEKAVVFSYLLQPLRILGTRLRADRERFGGCIYFHGGVTLEERRAAVSDFQSSPDVTTLLASTRTAGEGLTLTAASHVLFINEWWNPSVNQQARDRVVRIGQNQVVRVYRFRCKDTIEERLDEILATKRDEFEELVERLAADVQIGRS